MGRWHGEFVFDMLDGCDIAIMLLLTCYDDVTVNLCGPSHGEYVSVWLRHTWPWMWTHPHHLPMTQGWRDEIAEEAGKDEEVHEGIEAGKDA